MNVLILKHVENEGPGLIEDYLIEKDISYQIIDLSLSPCLPKPDGFSHIIILGGPMNVYEEKQYTFLKDEDLFIKEAIQRGKFVLGICLGAQLIAKALGAKVFKAPAKEIGWFEVSLTGWGLKDQLFFNLPRTFPVFQWHEDTFEIPISAKLIVTSNPVSHQAFRYGENVYGLQFHLEVTEVMIREWMKSYSEEFQGYHPFPRFSKAEILAETERKIKHSIKRGMIFLRNFFRGRRI